jgi:hypothetical protein
MQGRGKRESDWRIMRRCVAFVALLVANGTATATEHRAIILADAPELSAVDAAKRGEKDRHRLRDFGCVIDWDARLEVFRLLDAGGFKPLIEAAKKS